MSDSQQTESTVSSQSEMDTSSVTTDGQTSTSPLSPISDHLQDIGLVTSPSEESIPQLVQRVMPTQLPPPGVMMTDSLAEGLDKIALGDSMLDLSTTSDTPLAVELEERTEGSSIKPEKVESTPDITKYFSSDTADINVESNTKVFDSLLQPDSEASSEKDTSESESPETEVTLGKESKECPAQTDTPKDFHRVRQISQSEEVSVAFEEVKGQGGPPTVSASMENVRKFFTEDVSGEDVEGKSFFDTFTATDVEPIAEATEAMETPSLTMPDQTQMIGQMSPLGSPTQSLQHPLSGASPMPSPAHAIIPESNRSSISEDPFSISLKMSDTDRCHDAWLPSEATRQVLVAMVTSPPGTYIPEESQLTMPGIVIDEPQGDPVKDLIKKFVSELEAAKRKSVTAESVPQNEEGLRQLIKTENFRAAIDLTTILLTQQGQGRDKINQVTKHSTYSIQLWFTRIALLIKLRLYSHAESECQAFGNLDKPDLYYEFYPDTYPGRKGSIVPFNFRVLHAELPQFLGKSQESLDRLYYLHAIAAKIIANLDSGLAEDGSMIQLSDESRKTSKEVWEGRERKLLYSIGNCLMHIKDFNTAATVFESLLKKDEANKVPLMCGIGRIHLQMGDSATASKYFKQAQDTGDASSAWLQSAILVNRGFMALGQNFYAEARKLFKEATVKDPTNVVAVNNMAVCSLYMGQLKEALLILEELISRDPQKYLQEGLLFNLSTLYELESSRSINKKQGLLELVSKHKGNGFNVACLKLT